MAERKAILLRLRPEMVAALQRCAADQFRSVNGQIEFLLDRTLREAGRVAPPAEDAAPDSGPPEPPT